MQSKKNNISAITHIDISKLLKYNHFYFQTQVFNVHKKIRVINHMSKKQ